VTKFNLSIDLFTQDVRDAVDVAKALRSVADRLVKYTSTPWSPYALSGTIYSEEGKRPIGTWSVDPEAAVGLTITAENDPDSRVHCSRCGAYIRNPMAVHEICDVCLVKEARP
jgi:hypothetical protein